MVLLTLLSTVLTGQDDNLETVFLLNKVKSILNMLCVSLENGLCGFAVHITCHSKVREQTVYLSSLLSNFRKDADSKSSRNILIPIFLLRHCSANQSFYLIGNHLFIFTCILKYFPSLSSGSESMKIYLRALAKLFPLR